MEFRSVGLLALLGFCASCSAVRVSHVAGSTPNAPASKVSGVPFYPKKAKCRQEVVWLQPVYTLTLSVIQTDAKGTPQAKALGSVTLSRSLFDKQEVREFLALVAKGAKDENTVLSAWAKLADLASKATSPLTVDFNGMATEDRILAGRSAAAFVYVDYSDQYYINARVPLAGSANLSTKVAADGSLTEATTQVQNTALQTILQSLPISTLITGGLGLTPTKGFVPEEEVFQVAIAVSGFRHTLAKFTDFRTPCQVVADIALNDADEYKREDLSSPGLTKAQTPTDTTKKDSTTATPPGPSDPAAPATPDKPPAG